MPAPDSRTLILAAASGALNLRLMPAVKARYFDEVGNEGAGLAEPRAPALRAVVGLVWRTLLLWLVLLLLMTLASLFA